MSTTTQDATASDAAEPSSTRRQVPLVSECGQPAPQVLARDEAERRAALLRAVADPVRLQLLSIITAAPGQEACVCDMTDAVAVSQPTVSHHLKILVDAGLLARERRASWAWYRLDAPVLAELRTVLEHPAGK